MTLQDCIPYQCGFDPMNQAARYACSVAGFTGVRSCLDPLCQPWCPNPKIAPQVKTLAQKFYYPPVLTPQNLVRPVPSITEALMPIDTRPRGGWCGLNESISNHPLIAGAVLVGAFVLVVKGRRGR